MTNIIMGVCVLIIAIECLLIGIEYYKSNQNNKMKMALKSALEKNAALTQSLVHAEKQLKEAQAEVQGIYVLWNKSLESEKTLRQDLSIAKTQLTYLAQKIVQTEKVSAADPTPSASPSYWGSTSSDNIPLTSTQLINRQTYQISKSELI